MNNVKNGAILFSLFLLSSCMDEDISKISSSLSVEPDIAIPLIHSTTTLGDLLPDDEHISTAEDNLIWITYREDSIAQVESDSLLQIEDQAPTEESFFLGTIDIADFDIGMEVALSELTDNLERVSDAAKGVVKSLGDDLVKGVGSSNNQLKTQQGLLEKASKGQNVAKEVEKEIAKVQKEKATFERKLNAAKAAGATFNEETLYNQREYYESQLGSLFAINKINTEQIAQKGLTGNILENAKEYLITIDKSGLASKNSSASARVLNSKPSFAASNIPSNKKGFC